MSMTTQVDNGRSVAIRKYICRQQNKQNLSATCSAEIGLVFAVNLCSSDSNNATVVVSGSDCCRVCCRPDYVAREET